MANVDEMIERRRLRRRLTFWRLSAFVVLAGFVLALAGAFGAFETFSKRNSDHIAGVEIDGFIGNDEALIELLEKLGEKKQVKAVMLKISSPGGTTVGGEALYEAVGELREEKPVVTSVGSLAASAGYMIASASDHIVARRSSIVGSIGVIIQYGEVSRLLDKLGVEVDSVASTPLKAQPSPFRPASEEAKAMLERVVDDSYDWFVDIVAERRGFDRAKALRLADGSIFTGAQGLENGLVDAIGGEETARKWLVDEKGLSDDLKIVDWKPDRDDDSVTAGRAAIAAIAHALGLEIPRSELARLSSVLQRHLFLDGLVSVMHIEELSSRSGLAE